MNENELAYCHIDKWHAAGYKGHGIKIAIQEVAGVSSKNWARYGGRVLDPFGIRFSENLDTHQQCVIDVSLIAPEAAEIHLMSDNWLESLQYCIDNGIDVFNYSGTGNYSTDEFNALEQKALDAGVFFVCCAGNDGLNATDSLTGFSRKKTWLSVGSVQWGEWEGVVGPYRKAYSSWDRSGDDLDVMGFSDGLRIQSAGFSDGWMGITGTSFAAPWVVGLIALWKQKFIEDNKRKPTFSETYKFVIANAQDIEAAGYDQKTGHGVLRLPELPIELKCDVIEMWSGKAIATVNGEAHMLYTAPKLLAGRNMIGLRDVAELTGWAVQWDNVQKKITMTRERE